MAISSRRLPWRTFARLQINAPSQPRHLSNSTLQLLLDSWISSCGSEVFGKSCEATISYFIEGLFGKKLLSSSVFHWLSRLQQLQWRKPKIQLIDQYRYRFTIFSSCSFLFNFQNFTFLIKYNVIFLSEHTFYGLTDILIQITCISRKHFTFNR